MKTVFFDMDGVLVEYNSALKHIDETTRKEYEGHFQDIPGFFSMMEPMPGAIEAVKSLSQHYEVFILSTAPWKNPSALGDKRIWAEKHFGDTFFKRIILTHRKDIINGDYLIDDSGWNGASSLRENGLNSAQGSFLTGNPLFHICKEKTTSYLTKKYRWVSLILRISNRISNS